MRPEYMTAEEFVNAVLDVARDAGYGWIVNGRHHPDDLALNLGPMISAFAAGMSEAIRRAAN